LKLRARCKVFGGDALGPSDGDFLSECCSDMEPTERTAPASIPSITSSLKAMISQYGWDSTRRVVEVCVHFISYCQRYSHHQNRTSEFLQRVDLLLMLHSVHHSCSTKAYIVDAVKDFDTIHYKDLFRYPEEMVKLLRLFFQYGTNEQFVSFGFWLCTYEASLSEIIHAAGAYVAGISETAHCAGETKVTKVTKVIKCIKCIKNQSKNPSESRSLASDLVVKCLLPELSTQGRYGENVCSAPHVRAVLEAFSDLAQTKDADGKLLIHHAVTTGATNLKYITDIFNANREAVSVMDPVTRLYPFMAAASKGNIESAFKLLVADPSLIPSCMDSTSNGGKKKRKRALPS